MIIRAPRNTVLATDKLRPQFLLSEVRHHMASLGMNLPQHNLGISIVNRHELIRLMKHPLNTVVGLTITSYDRRGKHHHIYMLNGMSICRYKGTLAHECTHVWLNHRDSPLKRHSRKEVEGFCNLVAYKVLMFDTSKDAAVVRQNMLNNPDPIYGEGFRLMKQRESQMGWRRMLSSYA